MFLIAIAIFRTDTSSIPPEPLSEIPEKKTGKDVARN